MSAKCLATKAHQSTTVAQRREGYTVRPVARGFRPKHSGKLGRRPASGHEGCGSVRQGVAWSNGQQGTSGEEGARSEGELVPRQQFTPGAAAGKAPAPQSGRSAAGQPAAPEGGTGPAGAGVWGFVRGKRDGQSDRRGLRGSTSKQGDEERAIQTTKREQPARGRCSRGRALRGWGGSVVWSARPACGPYRAGSTPLPLPPPPVAAAAAAARSIASHCRRRSCCSASRCTWHRRQQRQPRLVADRAPQGILAPLQLAGPPQSLPSDYTRPIHPVRQPSCPLPTCASSSSHCWRQRSYSGASISWNILRTLSVRLRGREQSSWRVSKG